MNQIGRELPRLEARAKVSGRADYTHNLRVPGMLYGKVFRSTVPHGRIRSIDTGAAQAFPGVHRVAMSASRSLPFWRVIRILPSKPRN
jgi:CO/xanthine dehydrogenase Mo-binding subunit